MVQLLACDGNHTVRSDAGAVRVHSMQHQITLNNSNNSINSHVCDGYIAELAD
jgi:hypothetical protein